jgi:hypothetical protein
MLEEDQGMEMIIIILNINQEGHRWGIHVHLQQTWQEAFAPTMIDVRAYFLAIN